MKQIQTIDQRITFQAFSFKDLPTEAQERAITDHIQFEIEMMDEESPYNYLAEKRERMQTPWFLASEIYQHHKSDIIESIEVNDYLFDVTGDMIPIRTWVDKENKPIKHTWTFQGQKLEVRITDLNKN